MKDAKQAKKIKILPKRNNMARAHNFTREIRPNEEKTDAINNLEHPTNTKPLKSFLRLIQYFAKFMPNFSGKTDKKT